uniref:Petunia glycine-rich protein n=2 Tax=Petunia TaxID=4101 RepID=A0A0A1HAV7_PETHY|nr:unnamed protein product [Petunia x hybrida]
MGSKAFLILGLCLTILFLISSEAFARELAENTDQLKSANKNEAQVDGRSGYNGIGEDGYYGGRKGKGRGKGKGGGGYCRYGCCRKGYYKGCKKCCSYAGQAMDKVTETNSHN